MTVIPEDVLNYIKKIYPNNEYLETVDYLPEGMKYPHKEFFPIIFEEIQKKCDIEIYVEWDHCYESSLPVEIRFPEGNFNTQELLEEKIKMVGILYRKHIMLSTIGPFMDFQKWNKWYLDINDRIKIEHFITSVPEKCIQLDKCIKKILNNHKIKSIPREILLMSVPGMRGNNKGGKPPTVFNCLFENTWS